jgi:hypothetical protein
MKPVLAAVSLAASMALAVPLPGLAQECSALDAVPAAVLDAPFLVFGEVHGTSEVPAFVATYLCAATKRQRRITLAIEFPSSEQEAIDAFLASRGTPADIQRFTSTGVWRKPMQDGRTSAGMLQLVDSVRALRAGGTDIRLVAIDGDAQGPRRESLMAENLRTELRKDGGRQVLALIGGLHAIRNKGKRADPNYESAVYLLADQHPLSLTVGTAGGTAWICQGGTPASCHAATWDINRVSPAPATPFSLAPPSAQFDGVFFVGATTASPPAADQPR